MDKLKRVIVISLIIFFLLIILYSISGVAWLYFYDKTEFVIALKDAKQSFIEVGKDAFWEIFIILGIIFIWNFYRNKKQKSSRK